MPIASDDGALTFIDLNLPTASYYWRGLQLSHVLSVMVFAKPPAPRRIAIRVTDPASVVPALSPEQQASLNAIYAEMSAAGIVLMKVS